MLVPYHFALLDCAISLPWQLAHSFDCIDYGTAWKSWDIRLNGRIFQEDCAFPSSLSVPLGTVVTFEYLEDLVIWPILWWSHLGDMAWMPGWRKSF